MRYSILLSLLIFCSGPLNLAPTAHAASENNPSSQELIDEIQALKEQNQKLLEMRESLAAKNEALAKEYEAQQKEIETLKAKVASADKPTEASPAETPEMTKKAARIWKADVALGASLTRGNNDSHRVHAEFSAERKRDFDELDLGIEAEIGENEGQTTSEYIEAFGEYRRDISEKVYWYGIGKGRRDALADLDYRTTIGPGIGYRFLENDTYSLLFEGGPVYVAEKLSNESLEHSVRGRLFEEFIWQITSYAKFFQTAEFLTNFQETDDWIFELEAGVETSITETLSLRLSAKDIYDNMPAAGRKKNDLSLNSAIVYRFF